jgi:hypothetical protein
MAVTLNASNSGTGGLSVTSDATGVLALQTAGTTAVTVDTSQNVTIGDTSVYGKFAVRGYSGTVSGFNRVAHFGDGVSGCSAYVLQGGAGSNTIGMFTDNSSGILTFGTNFTERARIDTSGNLLVGNTTSPSNSGNISALGSIKGGAVYQSSGFENATYTLTTPATVYSLNKDQGAGVGSSSTTFNITGVSNVDGAFLFIYLRSSNTVGGVNCGANIQVHGTQLFSAAVQNTTKTITFGAFRQNGSWVATASATGNQISAFP